MHLILEVGGIECDVGIYENGCPAMALICYATIGGTTCSGLAPGDKQCIEGDGRLAALLYANALY